MARRSQREAEAMARRERQQARQSGPNARPTRAMAPRPGRTLVLCCGALAKDILALCRLNGWDHFDVRGLPAILHNHPEKICDALRDRIHHARPAYGERIVVGYADCGTGGMIDRLCEEEGVRRIAGPHCYSFFSGNAAFEAQEDADLTTFFLTDFLVDHFDTLVIRELGIDRHPELLEMYFGHYQKLVYLSQSGGEQRVAAAKAAAERLGLAYEYRETGWGDLESFLAEGASRQ